MFDLKTKSPDSSAVQTVAMPEATEMPLTVRIRRALEAVLFVAVWMGIGARFHLKVDAYLLAGIPLTILFQLVIRRQPIRGLWVRSAPAPQFDKRMVITFLALLPLPCMGLIHALRSPSGTDWIRAAWFLCAAAGAFPAAYALQNFTRSTFDSLIRCLSSAGVYGIVIFVAAGIAAHFHGHSPLTMSRIAIESMLVYLPVSFLLEEVTFRGLLDAHVHEPGKRSDRASAMLVSALWGLWHLPIVPHRGALWLLCARLLLFHLLVGVPLSRYWRRSGNLGVTAFTHSLIDAVRNALLGGIAV
jgi:hypothetical protein